MQTRKHFARHLARAGGRSLGLGLALAVASASSVLLSAPTAAHAQAEDDLREGDRHFDEGNWKKAAAAYDTAIRKFPAQVPATAFAKRAAVYLLLKDTKNGLVFIEKVAKPRHPDAPEVLEQEALLLWQSGRRAEAVTVAEKVVAKSPKTFSNQALIGEYFAARDPAKATGALTAYLDNRPAELEASDGPTRVRLGFAWLARARSASTEGRDREGTTSYGEAIKQFELVQRRFASRPGAAANADNGLCAAYAGQGSFDQAIALCERIVQDPRKVDKNASAWFNLATSYLAKRQPARARSATNEYVRLRRGEARGHIMLGDAYFMEGNWNAALEEYGRAESLLRPDQSRDQVQLSIKLGKTYRRLPTRDAEAAKRNLALAVQKLETGMGANPNNRELAIELGGAYLSSKRDADAERVAERLLADPSYAVAPPEQQTALLSVAGKALYNQNKLVESRARFEAARQIRPNDIELQGRLIDVINAQAYALLLRDSPAAPTLLAQAASIDPNSVVTQTNQAVLLLSQDKCAEAVPVVARLGKTQGADVAVYHRLAARLALCSATPDRAAAVDHFAKAEVEAKKVANNPLLAEIYVEWAPLLLDENIDDAVAKLNLATQASAGGADETGIGTAAKRNLVLAQFKRGWRSLKEGKATEAMADFDRALKDPTQLRGTEQVALEFSRALALLDKGDAGDAAKAFRALAAKGNQGSYLRAPYNKVGTQFFGAYANYRGGSMAQRTAAANEFTKLQGEASGAFANKIRDLIASSWEYVAYEQFRNGNAAAAGKALTAGLKVAEGPVKRRFNHNRTVMAMKQGDLAFFVGLSGDPAEAWVNAGVLYDQAGRPREAFDAWSKAKARGAQARDLQRWIDSKKRIYGY